MRRCRSKLRVSRNTASFAMNLWGVWIHDEVGRIECLDPGAFDK